MGIPLYTAEQTRALDAAAIDDHEIPGYTLMSRAGQACFQALRARWPEIDGLAIICGAGNNAGDGYVIARLARKARMEVTLHYLVDPDKLKGDAARAWREYRDHGGEAAAWNGQTLQGPLVVDAILGTGLDRPLDGPFKAAVEAINDSGLPVMSVDIPTGIHADRGAVMGEAVEADLTVTFIGRKRGLYTGRGIAHRGDLVFDALGVPQAAYDAVSTRTRLIGVDEIRSNLPPRNRNAHKGHFGSIAVLGGCRGMPGAPLMAAEAALRSGAGRVKLATHPDHAHFIPLACPALMCEGVDKADALKNIIEWSDVVALGPGLGQGDWSGLLYERALASDRPLVVDADALNLLAKDPQPRGNWILTPHPGEAGRLLDCAVADIEVDRYAAAREIAERYAAICILKGAGTVIAGDDGDAVCGLGNPGMASAGMGDVLTGIVAAMLGQGLAPTVAAETAACVHARAGDLAAGGGERGLIATDLLTTLRRAVNPGR